MSTILVIDDHPAFRMIIKMQLMQLLGIDEVIEADNGQTAVELARQHAPKLAILDLDIPRISGLDVISRLKLVHPPIRVLVLSGHDPATFAPRAMRSGVHGFVGKSQELKEIMRGVEASTGWLYGLPGDGPWGRHRVRRWRRRRRGPHQAVVG
jgi:two-component system response regulator EvgA